MSCIELPELYQPWLMSVEEFGTFGLPCQNLGLPMEDITCFFKRCYTCRLSGVEGITCYLEDIKI